MLLCRRMVCWFCVGLLLISLLYCAIVLRRTELGDFTYTFVLLLALSIVNSTCADWCYALLLVFRVL